MEEYSHVLGRASMIKPRCLRIHRQMHQSSNLNLKGIRFHHVLDDDACIVVDLGEAEIGIPTCRRKLINGYPEKALALHGREDVLYMNEQIRRICRDEIAAL